jgi:hypothetical protein
MRSSLNAPKSSIESEFMWRPPPLCGVLLT